jgi:hypothetical protein
MMKEIPILFSTPMVQAILEGRKTQTRRLIKDKLQPVRVEVISGRRLVKPSGWPLMNVDEFTERLCPYGKPGDQIWCRETWRGIKQDFGPERIEYKATETINLTDKWRPSIFMPKEAARIWLKVESVRVERLQDIPYPDIEKEGISLDQLKGCDPCLPASIHLHHEFKKLWERINGTDSWQANPWVWVVSFKVLSITGKPDLQTT